MTDKLIINGVDVIDELEELNKQREFCKSLGVCEKKHWECLYYSTRKKLFEEISTLEQQSSLKDKRIVELEQILSQIAEEIEEYREDCIDYEGDDTEGYCYGCQSVYCLAQQIKQIAQEEYD